MADISFQTRDITDKERVFIAQRLLEHTERELGMQFTHGPFNLLAFDGQKLMGGVVAKIFLNWMHLDLVWVDEAYRGKGIGAALLKHIHDHAAQMGLTGIEVWTQSWQAPEFYRKQGYSELVAFEDFTPGRSRHILRQLVKRP